MYYLWRGDVLWFQLLIFESEKESKRINQMSYNNVLYALKEGVVIAFIQIQILHIHFLRECDRTFLFSYPSNLSLANNDKFLNGDRRMLKRISNKQYRNKCLSISQRWQCTGLMGLVLSWRSHEYYNVLRLYFKNHVFLCSLNI
jgi:hypothetical protein